MTISAIFQGDAFLGVVETDEVKAIVKDAGITDYRQIDDVKVIMLANECSANTDYDMDESVVYYNGMEEIDDLRGGVGNAVIKA